MSYWMLCKCAHGVYRVPQSRRGAGTIQPCTLRVAAPVTAGLWLLTSVWTMFATRSFITEANKKIPHH